MEMGLWADTLKRLFIDQNLGHLINNMKSVYRWLIHTVSRNSEILQFQKMQFTQQETLKENVLQFGM